MIETHRCHGCNGSWSHDVAEELSGLDEAGKEARFLAIHACPTCGKFNVFCESDGDELSDMDNFDPMIQSEVFAFVASTKIGDLDAWEGSDAAKAEIRRMRSNHQTIQEHARVGTPFDVALAMVVNDIEEATGIWAGMGEDPAEVPPAFGLPSVTEEDVTVEMIVDGYAQGLGTARGVARPSKVGVAWDSEEERAKIVAEVDGLRGENAAVLARRVELARDMEENFGGMGMRVKVIRLTPGALVSLLGGSVKN